MVLNYIYNSAVQAMPAIDEHCGKFYAFTYKFAHGLAGNWGLVGKRTPNEGYVAALAASSVPVELATRLID